MLPEWSAHLDYLESQILGLAVFPTNNYNLTSSWYQEIKIYFIPLDALWDPILIKWILGDQLEFDDGMSNDKICLEFDQNVFIFLQILSLK